MLPSVAMKYRQSFEVRFCESDRRSHLTPIALFQYLQEAAIGHGDAVEMDGDALTDLGYAWMMNRLHMHVERYPKRRETVEVETWGSSLQGLYAIREWRMTDAANEVIARATARWIILDIAKRKIIRLPEVLAERYGEHKGRGLEDPFDRMTPIESGMHEKTFHVRVSELDTNQHANSASYIDWCLEAVPDEVLNEYAPESLEITYKKESKLGDGLVAQSIEETAPASDARAFRHAIRLEETGDLLTMAASVWRRVE